jgi:inner membrane protein
LPTVLSHSVIAVSGSLGFWTAKNHWKLMILSIFCSVFPDVDVIGYHWFYIPYHSFFGHRGFFHSPFFAAVLSLLIVTFFYRKEAPFTKRSWLFLYFFILTTSHGILDALTDGGQGIAMLSPFSKQRYFFPWTPLEVSPLSLQSFLSQRGFNVIRNELLWIWIPSFFIAVFINLLRNRNKNGGDGCKRNGALGKTLTHKV